MPGARAPAANLAMRPAGWAGRVFATLMEAMNAEAYARALEVVAPQPGWKILELGFGTGRLVEMLVGSAPEVSVAGLDPTEDMVKRALSRPSMKDHAPRVDLRLGSADEIVWPQDTFDAAVAVHSFQFWANPAASLGALVRVLKPGGRLTVVLRYRAGRQPSWLPNRVSRGGAELAGLTTMLGETGFQNVQERKAAGRSHVVTGEKPVR